MVDETVATEKNEAFLKKVGRKVGEIRSQKGFTQIQLSKKIGVSVQMVQYWESGRNITLRTLFNLSRYLKHPIHDFLNKPLNNVVKRGRPRRKPSRG